MKHIPLLLACILLFTSCTEEEIPTPSSAQYLSWTEGDWWVYEWYTHYKETGDTVFHSLDTTYALPDTMINGETYRTLSTGLFPWSEKMYLRDSSGYVLDRNGNVVYSYVNFTDTFINLLDSTYGWYTQMIEDPFPTTVPAGMFNTINYRATHYHFKEACGDSIYYSDRQFSDGIGMVRMSYHYAAPGPCIDNVRRLVDYYVQ